MHGAVSCITARGCCLTWSGRASRGLARLLRRGKAELGRFQKEASRHRTLCRWCAGSTSCRRSRGIVRRQLRKSGHARHAAGQQHRHARSLFSRLARDISAVARMPVMVTGGIRRRAIAEQALQPSEGRPGVAMVGIASAMAFEPKLPERWKAAKHWILTSRASAGATRLMRALQDGAGEAATAPPRKGQQPKPDASPCSH